MTETSKSRSSAASRPRSWAYALRTTNPPPGLLVVGLAIGAVLGAM